MWPLLSDLVDESIVVELNDMAAAMRLVADRTHVVIEVAAACAVAAAKTRTRTRLITPARALYGLLETQIVSMFYDRDDQGVPQRWLQVAKEASRTVTPQFSAKRMVKHYVWEMYAPALASTRQSVPTSSEEP